VFTRRQSNDQQARIARAVGGHRSVVIIGELGSRLLQVAYQTRAFLALLEFSEVHRRDRW
jgi:hypothetical protein